MTFRIVPVSAILLLIAGSALIWIWEFALAAFGENGFRSWLPLILGIVLLFLAFFKLEVENRR